VAVECYWEGKKSFMLIFMDVSQKLKNKRLKELNEYKDHLLATVTHDLKTPLNGML
jgi:signal transduction histidine kinase